MKRFLTKEAYVNSMMDSAVIIQTSSHSVPSTPSWFGEVVLIVEHLHKQGILSKLSERVRFSRRRFGRDVVIDFLAVLFGYAISGERTLEAFYQRLQPFAAPFMALFERDRLPARSTLSRFLTALTQEPVDALSCKQAIWWIGREVLGSSLMSMAPVRRPANAPCLRPRNCHQPARRLEELCAAFLHGTQARGHRANPDRHPSGSLLAMARLLWQPRQWTLPNRIAPGALRQWSLPGFPPPLAGAGLGALRWAIWHGGGDCRPGRFPLRDARERLHGARSSS